MNEEMQKTFRSTDLKCNPNPFFAKQNNAAETGSAIDAPLLKLLQYCAMVF